MPQRELEGLGAIVTGSTGNLGSATAKTLAQAGAKVLINGRTSEEKAAENLETAIDKILSKGFRTADLADGSSEVLSCSEIGDKIMDEI